MLYFFMKFGWNFMQFGWNFMQFGSERQDQSLEDNETKQKQQPYFRLVVYTFKAHIYVCNYIREKITYIWYTYIFIFF